MTAAEEFEGDENRELHDSFVSKRLLQKEREP
jgi:hypothetical protein